MARNYIQHDDTTQRPGGEAGDGVRDADTGKIPARWEWLAVGAAALLALAMGFANLGEPSLWHDELVHAYVGKSIADIGTPALPSGTPYYSGTTINFVLAGVIKIWGMSESALRTPSVLLSALNVVLTFLVVRALLGSIPAVIAAFAMALCPWTVAWAREARFYTLQQTFYLVTVYTFWRMCESENLRKAALPAVLCVAAYTLSILTSFHSILFLGGIGGYAIWMALYERKLKSRWTLLVASVTVAGLLAIAGLAGMMNALDREAVLDRGGIGGQIVDEWRAHRMYYTHWLRMNLSTGFFIAALFGFAAMLVKEGRRGLFAALAFWAPILVLTFFIGYRRPRFMFFAFPFYVAAASYAIVVAAEWLRKPKPGWVNKLAAAALLLFAARLALSALYLAGDTLEVAGGSHLTLARRHPHWKEPCAYVKENLGDSVVLTTTYLPVYHYVGRVDNWYPAHDIWWEEDESGLPGLERLEDLQRFMQTHPKGFFIAEWWRFGRNIADRPWSDFSADIAWVNDNMTLIAQASSEDVTVYAWGQE